MPDTVPWPDALLEQPAPDPSAPPMGMERLKAIADPDTVPLSEPVALTPLPLSVIVSVPEKLVPLWVSVHDIGPVPLESVAVPDQTPLRLAVVVDVEPDEEGDVGEPPQPLQPATITANPNAARDIRVNCVKIIGRSADFIMAELVV